MSIVVDMDMPKSCAECPLHTDAMSKVFCGQTHKCVGTTVACYERMKDCPIKCDIEDINAEIEGLMSHDDYMVDGFNVLDIIDKHIKG